jgi:tetratricopeptide (TPR) repeat protein
MDHMKVGTYKMMLKDFEGAEKAFKKAIELGPEHWQTHYNYGQLKLVQNDLPAARKLYEKSIPLVRNLDSRPFNELGYVLMHQREFDKAEPLFRKSIEINPNALPPYMNLAVLERNRKNIAKAREWAEKAAVLAKDDAQMSEKVKGILDSLSAA